MSVPALHCISASQFFALSATLAAHERVRHLVCRYEHSAPFRKQETWETNATAIAETIAFVEAIAQKYSGQDALLGISLLNEPTVPLFSSRFSHTLPQQPAHRNILS